jgi:hypothetical protein
MGLIACNRVSASTAYDKGRPSSRAAVTCEKALEPGRTGKAARH